MSEPLKPCRCGKTPRLLAAIREGVVECECGETVKHVSRHGAVEMWNRRAETRTVPTATPEPTGLRVFVAGQQDTPSEISEAPEPAKGEAP